MSGIDDYPDPESSTRRCASRRCMAGMCPRSAAACGRPGAEIGKKKRFELISKCTARCLSRVHSLGSSESAASNSVRHATGNAWHPFAIGMGGHGGQVGGVVKAARGPDSVTGQLWRFGDPFLFYLVLLVGCERILTRSCFVPVSRKIC